MDNFKDVRPVFIKKNENLSRDQIRTLNVLRGRARIDSEASYDQIIDKLKSIEPNTASIIHMLQNYIDSCQLNINFRAQLFKIFASDTHYRSVYELHQTSSTRDIAEDRIFLNLYKNITAFERPKYGSLDIHSRPGKDAYGYGECYFVLDDNVRIRTTLASCDSFCNTSIGVLDYPMHVLNELPIKELIHIYNIAIGKSPNSEKTFTYKEVQFHGPIDFAKDIKCVCVPKSVESDKYFIEFITKFDLSYMTF